jgi:hypothetical protein
VTGAVSCTAPVKIAAKPAALKTGAGTALELHRCAAYSRSEIAFRTRREGLSISTACCIAKTYFFGY